MLASSFYYVIIFLIFTFNYAFGKNKPLGHKRGDEFQRSFGITESLGRKIQLGASRLRKILTNSVLDKEQLFFDDILLMPDQIDALIRFHHKNAKEFSSRNRSSRKKVVSRAPGIKSDKAPFNVKKWSLPITYIISDESDSIATVILAAISHIQDHTCIRFKQQPQGTELQKRHVYFNTAQVGCGSHIGQTEEMGKQFINIGSCKPNVGVIVHEIFHCLGFLHEQSRRDAKKHVKIIKGNIISGEEVNFLPFPKNSVINFGPPYDFNSVMHYNKFISSINSRNAPTIVTKDKLFNKNIGQSTGLSFYDKDVLNLVYCKATCAEKLSCKRGGFTDPNNCSQCVCNDGFGGRLCEKVGPSHDNCLPNTRSIIRVTSSKTERCLESPNYDSGGYKPFSECNWYLKSQPGTKISLSFKGDFSIYCEESTQTCFHWVEIKYRNNLVYPGPRFCCQSKPSVNLVSDNNEVLISFRSSFDNGNMSKNVLGGFKLCYKLHTKRSSSV